MTKKLTPEDQAQWERISKEYRQTQLKMVQKRKELGELLKVSRQKLSRHGTRTASRAREFLVLQLRLAELGLAQIECYAVDSPVFQVPTQALTPAFEARTLEIALVTAQMDYLLLARLDGLLRRDIPAAQAGKAPPKSVPDAWLAERERCLHDPERLLAWERFRQDFANLDTALQALLAQKEAQEVPATGVEYLANMKALKVPQLSGLVYRVHTALKLLDGAESVFDALCKGFTEPPKTSDEGLTTSPRA